MYRINKKVPNCNPLITKTAFVIFIIINCFCIFSCKNASESKLAYDSYDSVKNQIKNREQEISWTKEIEGERLTTAVSVDEKLSKQNISINPDLVKIIKDYNQPVYPYLSDFGSLDTREINKTLQESLDNFCKSLSKNPYSGLDSFFDNSYIFNYVFFKNDFISGWKSSFNEDFPYTEKQLTKIAEKNAKIEAAKKRVEEAENAKVAEKTEADSAPEVETQSESSKSNTENTSEKTPEIVIDKATRKLAEKNIEEVNIFSGWIFGQPFVGDEIIQVPVRFYCQNGTIDVTLYVNRNKSNSIYQITIDRWGRV